MRLWSTMDQGASDRSDQTVDSPHVCQNNSRCMQSDKKTGGTFEKSIAPGGEVVV